MVDEPVKEDPILALLPTGCQKGFDDLLDQTSSYHIDGDGDYDETAYDQESQALELHIQQFRADGPLEVLKLWLNAKMPDELKSCLAKHQLLIQLHNGEVVLDTPPTPASSQCTE